MHVLICKKFELGSIYDAILVKEANEIQMCLLQLINNLIYCDSIDNKGIFLYLITKTTLS